MQVFTLNGVSQSLPTRYGTCSDATIGTIATALIGKALDLGENINRIHCFFILMLLPTAIGPRFNNLVRDHRGYFHSKTSPC